MIRKIRKNVCRQFISVLVKNVCFYYLISENYAGLFLSTYLCHPSIKTAIYPGKGQMNLDIYSYGNRIFIRCDAPAGLKEATLFNLLGQEISNHKLEPVSLNEISVANISSSYIIRINTTEGIHTARIYIQAK